MNPDESAGKTFENAGASESQRFIARMQTQRKNRYAKAAGLMLIAVLAGVAIGASGAVLYMKSYYHRVPPKRAAIGESILAQMNSVVQLKKDEEDKVKEILSSHLSEVDEIRRASTHNTRQVFGRMNEEIEAVIGEDRFKLWEEYKVKNWGDYKNRTNRNHGRRRHQGGTTR